MSADAALLASSPYDTKPIGYRDLSGAMNTRKAPHDLDRKELAFLSNAWYAYGTALSKRPGSSIMGATGAGVGGQGIVAARFNDITYLVVQMGTNIYWTPATGGGVGVFTHIGTITAGGILRGAQMYDPKTGADTMFLVSGKDTPQMWTGPGNNLVNVTTGNPSTGNLPNKPGTGAGATNPITPAFVATLGNNSHLFYSGDKSAPNAVYISDSFNPESFTTPAMQADPYGYNGAGSIFLPAIIGLNDGVDGGSVTGLQTLGFSMIIFKESAVYAMVQTQLLGNVAWQVYNVTAQRGCLSPRAIIPFETFIVFLAIDGLYITFGQPSENMTKQKISVNAPSLFDSTRFGLGALIVNRTTAVAVREGNRYCIWFDVGKGVPTQGAWFDFDVPTEGTDESSPVPTFGLINGMTVGGAVSMTGPADDGNFAWVDASFDSINHFGLAFSDPVAGVATPIAVQLTLKADTFESEFGANASIRQKVPSRLDIAVTPLTQGVPTSLQFFAWFSADFSSPIPTANALPPINTVAQAGEWGQNWGGFNWSSSGLTEAGYAVLEAKPQKYTMGRVLQIMLSEQSIFPWILVGLVLEANAQEVQR